MPSAAILAGGRATRFGGRDKSALLVGGRPILDRQVTALATLCDDIMLVVGDRAPAAPRAGLRLVRDRIPDCGPLGGLDAALAAARHDALLLVACDLPFITARLLGHLLALTAEADAIVPRTERGYHPLCAAYTRACQAAIAARLDRRQLRMVDFLADVRVRVVGGDELAALGNPHRLLANVNTPSEYDGLDATIGHEL
jgi:molybdopterin-guanine dinucleotide biosynthesis protein A